MIMRSLAGMTCRPASSTLNEARRRQAAWLAVIPAFVAGFVVFGLLYGFGVFLDPIAADLQTGRTAVSALFSAAGVVFYAAGSLTGGLGDRCGVRTMLCLGAVVLGAGLAATAFVDRLWIAYLTYGVAVGIGAACVYVPTLATLASITAGLPGLAGTALGIAATGTGCGMLVMPPVAASLIVAFGWRRAALGLAIVNVVLLVASIAATRPSYRSDAVAWRPLGAVVRSSRFAWLYASWVFATAALFVSLAFLPAFALRAGIDPVAASALVSVLGGASILGRLGIGALNRRFGSVGLFRMAVFAMACSYALWLVATSYGVLLVFAASLGVAYGVRIALVPSVLIETFGDRNPGAILGLFLSGSGLASLGPLLAGFMIDQSGSDRAVIVLALALGFLGVAPIASLGRAGGIGQRILSRMK